MEVFNSLMLLLPLLVVMVNYLHVELQEEVEVDMQHQEENLFRSKFLVESLSDGS